MCLSINHARIIIIGSIDKLTAHSSVDGFNTGMQVGSPAPYLARESSTSRVAKHFIAVIHFSALNK
jgi:hypothetical protein